MNRHGASAALTGEWLTYRESRRGVAGHSCTKHAGLCVFWDRHEGECEDVNGRPIIGGFHGKTLR